ncbi:MAG: hypothetical protein WCY19_08885 [Candidatus Gastranaerophilaceae bacterium]
MQVNLLKNVGIKTNLQNLSRVISRGVDAFIVVPKQVYVHSEIPRKLLKTSEGRILQTGINKAFSTISNENARRCLTVKWKSKNQLDVKLYEDTLERSYKPCHINPLNFNEESIKSKIENAYQELKKINTEKIELNKANAKKFIDDMNSKKKFGEKFKIIIDKINSNCEKSLDILGPF